MSDSKHTPGPWHISRDIEDRPGRTVNPYAVAGAGWDVSGAAGATVCRVHVKAYKREPGYSNAALIAAAPELLAALERLEKAQHACRPRRDQSQLEAVDEWQKERHAASDAARAAIARARGEK